jgi:hypothetical protein
LTGIMLRLRARGKFSNDSSWAKREDASKIGRNCREIEFTIATGANRKG